MKQSLLAFLAMAIFSLLALSQQRAAMHYHSLIYGRDYEIAAMNMVSEQLAYIETLYFDEADTDSPPLTQRLETDDLSANMGLELGEISDLRSGPGATQMIGADDIDDYHLFSLSAVPYEFNNINYAFDLRIEVCYVDPLGAPAPPFPGQTAEEAARARCQSAKSLAKQVIVTINESLPETELTEAERQNSFRAQTNRTPIGVTISRVFSHAGLDFH